MERKRRIGCFARAAQIEEIARLGFDSVELDAAELVGMGEEAFAAFCRRAGDTGLGFPALSGLIPLTERIHAENFDWRRWVGHAQKAAERMARLSGETIVFGAGKCRSIPPGCADLAAARRRVRDFAADVCDAIAPYRLRLAVEPLGPRNSNYLNYIGEGAAFAQWVGRPNCFTMCDLRHMVKLGEDWGEIAAHRDAVVHAHIDCPLGDARRFPQKGDGYDYRPYLRALDAAGYEGALTAEALDYTDFSAEAAGFLETIAEQWPR